MMMRYFWISFVLLLCSSGVWTLTSSSPSTQQDICLTGTYTGDSNPDCAKDNGHCGTDGVCGPNIVETASTCCKPDSVLCPNTKQPYAFQSNSKPYYGFMEKKHKLSPIETECHNKNGFVHQVNNENICCSFGEMDDVIETDFRYFADAITKSGTKTCTADTDCTNGMCKTAKSGSKLCFKKIQCPDTTVYTSKVGTCAPTELTIKMTKKDDSNIAANDTTPVTFCCLKSAYAGLPSIKCAASLTGGMATKDGTIKDVPQAKCVSTDPSKYLKWVELLPGKKIAYHCCEYDISDKIVKIMEDAAARCGHKDDLMRSYTDRTKPVKCNLATSPQGCVHPTNGLIPNSMCMEDPNTPGYGYCCEKLYCSGLTGTSETALRSEVVSCKHPDCHWNHPDLADQKDQVCKRNLDHAGEQKCCPPKVVCDKNGNCGLDLPSYLKGKGPYRIAGKKCGPNKKCGNGQHCDGGECKFAIASRYLSGQSCQNDADCGDQYFYCVSMNGARACASFVKLVDASKATVDKRLLFGVIACGLIALISGIAAMIFFMKYRSRNFCDKVKKRKDLKKGKSSTTDGTTDGGTTESAK